MKGCDSVPVLSAAVLCWLPLRCSVMCDNSPLNRLLLLHCDCLTALHNLSQLAADTQPVTNTGPRSCSLRHNYRTMQGRKLDPRAQCSRQVSMRMRRADVSWGRSHEGVLGAGCWGVYMFILAGLCTKDTLSGRAGREVAGVDMERSYHRATQHWLQSSSKYGSSGRYEVVTSDWILGPASILAVTRHCDDGDTITR